MSLRRYLILWPSTPGVGLSRGRELWYHHGLEESNQSQGNTEQGLGKGGCAEEICLHKIFGTAGKMQTSWKRVFVVPKAQVKKKKRSVCVCM